MSISYVLATLLETFVFAENKEKEVIKSKNERLQTELKLLKSQINPHFLFNALNNIYALSAIDSTKTQESIYDLSSATGLFSKQSLDDLLSVTRSDG